MSQTPFLAGAVSASAFPIFGSILGPFDQATQYFANYHFPVRQLNEWVLVTLLHRGEIEESIFYDIMQMLGYNAVQTMRFVQSAKQLPSKTDQVRYVVKEAYTPKLIEDLLSKEGLEPPAEFTKQMQRLGFRSDDALKEWIAHYDPLGRGEFEELFHRLNAEQLAHKSEDLVKLGITADEVKVDLDFLLRMYKIKDIYPALRKRMALISYRPLARIDIRRLEDYDLIEPAELEFMNREIGYSPHNAKLLAQFTVLANTMTDIKPLIMSGALSLDDGEKILMQNGATAKQADKLMKRLAPYAKANKAKDDRDLTIADYLEAFEVGLFDRLQTKAELIKMGLDDKEAELKIRIKEFRIKIAAEKKAKGTKNLTKTDILKRYRDDTGYNRTKALADLVNIGYDADESKFIMDTEDKKTRGAKR